MLRRMVLFALFGILIASAKNYTFTVSNESQAGSTTLKPG